MQEWKERLHKVLQEKLPREISRLEDRAKQLPAKLEDTISAIDDVPKTDIGLLYDIMPIGALRVDLPRDQKLMTEYLKQVGRGPWRPVKDIWASQSDNGDVYYRFTHEDRPVELTVCFSADRECATCRLEQTGVKEVPIYEMVCDDDPKDCLESG